MSQLTLGFTEAAQYLSDRTYLEIEDAEAQLKLMYHIGKFTKSLQRAPETEEIQKMAEYSRRDKALSYRTLSFPVLMVDKMISAVNRTNPSQIVYDEDPTAQ